ncbi:hypothetical protein A5658_04310 [Mycobacterium sp. 1245111.1]|uniref:hypothetical protein n=1 Tax=Mycobacterium sp. 1245111.1 TaxID=1834073 RepID=UPI0008007FE9|nr:hypothetical protein [Mycobacterium sp. 1245111.1]OBK37186.1 hypothetical protein A5658_04310 [Mycobacterium sp. 1245111.1]
MAEFGLKSLIARTAAAALLAAPLLSVPTAHAVPLHCGGVGGVFVAHGTDGRGDCEPADSRAKCHIPPADQGDDYIGHIALDPLFPGGALAFGQAAILGMSSNKDCWKVPPS